MATRSPAGTKDRARVKGPAPSSPAPGDGSPADGAEADGALPDRAQVDGAQPMNTRERILDIALDLFIDKGYDKTSLREIAEKLGFSKAALYYHFASKDDILLALHYRIHDVLQETLGLLGSDEMNMASWSKMLDRVIEQMLANRRLFVLHERNRAAFEKLHNEGHDSDHGDFEGQCRRVLADPSVPLRDRVRLSCSLGAVMSGLLLTADLFGDVSTATLAEMLSDAVRDLLNPEKPAP
jgi:AcrR family transcriptional regulator